MVRTVGVRAELRDEPGDDASVDLVLQVFARLENGREVVAHTRDRQPRLILGLRRVDHHERARFVRLHLREAYLDPIAGDPLAWQALIAALEVEGLRNDVYALRGRPFAVELGPRLTEALD